MAQCRWRTRNTEMKSEKSLPAKDFRAARAPGARHLAAGLVAIAAILFAPAALAQSEQKSSRRPGRIHI